MKTIIIISVIAFAIWLLCDKRIIMGFKKPILKLGDCWIVISWRGKYGIIKGFRYLHKMQYDKIEIVGCALVATKGKEKSLLSLHGERLLDECSEIYHYPGAAKDYYRIIKKSKWVLYDIQREHVVHISLGEISDDFSGGDFKYLKDGIWENCWHDDEILFSECSMVETISYYVDYSEPSYRESGYQKAHKSGKWGLYNGIIFVTPIEYDHISDNVNEGDFWGEKDGLSQIIYHSEWLQKEQQEANTEAKYRYDQDMHWAYM